MLIKVKVILEKEMEISDYTQVKYIYREVNEDLKDATNETSFKIKKISLESLNKEV